MVKWFTGGAAALVIWMGSAMAADAQINVTTTGPQAVLHTDTQTTVTGTVTGVSAYSYNITIKVAGVQKYGYNYIGSGASICRAVTGLGTWGLQPGQLFETRLTLTAYAKSNTLAITVSEGGYSRLAPMERRAAPKPAALKEEELCLAGADEEAAA